nr:SH3 domain-containing protein C23A1.17-like [Triticum aestivum]
MVSDDAFDSCPASASSAAAATAASASSAAPPPSTLETDSPFMASTPPAWARQAASDSRPTAPSRSPTPDLSASARSPAPSYGAQIVAPVHYGAAPGPSRDAPPAAGLYGAAPGQSRDAPPAAGLYGAPAQQPYGAPIQQSYDAPGFYGAPVQQPYGGVYPMPDVAQSSTPYALSPVVSSEAPYGAPYAAPGSHVMPPLQPYGVPPLQPYGHHQHSRAPPSADALTPCSASPTYDSQLPASVSEPGPFHFAHLVTVKLSADNYLLWRAQVLPLMLNHYLEGYVDGTLLGPPAMVQVPSAGGGSVMVSNPAHHRWIAQDQAILSAIQSSLTPSVASMVLGKVKKNDLSVTTFFNKVKTLADTLSSIRKPLRDEEFTSFILNGLDEDYDSLVENINGRDMPMPPRDLYARLLNTEQRLAARRSIGVYTEGPSANAALHGGARGAMQKAPPSSGSQPRPPAPPPPTSGRKRLHYEACGGGVECKLCGIEGHLASRCHRRFKRDFLGIGNNGKGNEKQAALATQDPGFTPSYMWILPGTWTRAPQTI